ncbi:MULTISPECIES: sulfur carrier protein ThiS [Rodentibacter]|uniref:sulfur carrier protein ThiS n=1 Tax=Rodentibacter TaxID=1960084 RepID=UPI001CFF4946|nr:sulfur carrier protein ThiS [Rodentibacter sp. JRC1]GJI55811.1 sulfur carrier protein ThiS [Rodentibacter sp. JRC1]
MQIHLNEKTLEISTALSLADLISEHYPNQNGLAVAVNQQIIPKNQWEDYLLQAQDKLSVFRAIAGG